MECGLTHFQDKLHGLDKIEIVKEKSDVQIPEWVLTYYNSNEE